MKASLIPSQLGPLWVDFLDHAIASIVSPGCYRGMPPGKLFGDDERSYLHHLIYMMRFQVCPFWLAKSEWVDAETGLVRLQVGMVRSGRPVYARWWWYRDRPNRNYAIRSSRRAQGTPLRRAHNLTPHKVGRRQSFRTRGCLQRLECGTLAKVEDIPVDRPARPGQLGAWPEMRCPGSIAQPGLLRLSGPLH